MASLVLALARRRGLQVVPNLPSVFCPLTTLSGWWVGSNGQLTAPLLLASISSLLSTRGSFSCLSQHFFSSLGLLLSSWLVDPTQTVQGIPNSPPLLHEKLPFATLCPCNHWPAAICWFSALQPPPSLLPTVQSASRKWFSSLLLTR